MDCERLSHAVVPSMTPDEWKEIRAHLEVVLELSAEAKDDYLQRLGETDPHIRREVEKLLAAAGEATEDFLEAPCLPDLVKALGRSLPSPRFSLTSTRPSSLNASAEAFGFVGQHVGPYHILKEIGRGGMGVVCLAERDDGQYRKRVALKLMRQGLDRRILKERFKQERQILAHLEHPNIAHLLDGGATSEGLPYLVMEYVDGLPIDQWCTRRQLGVEARLQLFLQVCAAVQHAHQLLIVHRDLKPSNILVTEAGVPKLLDFGIAKVLEEEANPDTALTQHGAMTPLYASPEQVQGLPPTTSTDVYSLGVILYELLTGQRPYQLKSFSAVELVQVVCHEEPKRVSEKAEQPKLKRQLMGDLDSILAKALRKEPAHRYLSVEQFAEDIRRHLKGLPVLARQGNARYLAGKFIRRNRYLVAAGGAFVLLLVVSLLLMGVQASRLAAQRDAARLERDKAEQMSAFLRSLFEVNVPTESQGRDITARELLERGAERIRHDLPNQPELQTELMDVIARVYTSLAQYDRAEQLLKDALSRRQDVDARTSDASFHLHLAEVYQAQARYEAARGELDAALTALQQEKGEKSSEVAGVVAQQARLQQAQGEFAQAETLFRRVLSLQSQASDTRPVALAITQRELGVTLDQQGRPADAAQWYRDALQTLEKAGDTERAEYASALNNLGAALAFQGRYDESLAMHQKALALRKRLFGTVHPAVARSLHNMAADYGAQGQFEEARALAQSALEIKQQLYTERHPETVKSMDFIVKLGFGTNDPQLEPMARKALEIRRALLGEQHPDTAISLATLGLVLVERGQLSDAEQLLHQAYTIQQSRLGTMVSERGETLLGLGELRLAQGRTAEAEQLLREGVAHWQRNPLDLTWWVARAQSLLAQALLMRHAREPAPARVAEAQKLLQTSQQVLARCLGPAHPYSRLAVKLAHSPALTGSGDATDVALLTLQSGE